MLSFLRKASDDGKKDWAGFSSALEHIFPKEDDDIEPQRKNSRQELAAFFHVSLKTLQCISPSLPFYALFLLPGLMNTNCAAPVDTLYQSS